jgi:large subunit ribosomal protein L40
MFNACEALRTLGEDGMAYTTAPAPTAPEDGAAEAAGKKKIGIVGALGTAVGDQGKDVGRLFRLAMEKKGVWQGVPIESTRIQTEAPGRDGWDYGWRR